MQFSDRLIHQCRVKKSLVLVGIDPRLDQLPEKLQQVAAQEGAAKAFEIFGCEVIDAVSDIAVAIKPQIAFFEMLGVQGLEAFRQILLYAREKGLLTIADIKRGDIGSTAEAYATAYLSRQAEFPSDAVTINGYLGIDGVAPFLKYCGKEGGKGVYILVKTSNPSSVDFQDQMLENQLKVFESVAKKVAQWGEPYVGESGYSDVGAVVGATWPAEAVTLREYMPQIPFLIPGYGAQGGTAKDAMLSMDINRLGGIVNSSRGIIFAHRLKEFESYASNDWQKAVRMATEKMRLELQS